MKQFECEIVKKLIKREPVSPDKEPIDKKLLKKIFVSLSQSVENSGEKDDISFSHDGYIYTHIVQNLEKKEVLTPLSIPQDEADIIEILDGIEFGFYLIMQHNFIQLGCYLVSSKIKTDIPKIRDQQL